MFGLNKEGIMKDIATKFPNDIDNRLFFSDISSEQVHIMNTYNNYIANGDYDKASEFLNNSEVFFYGAWLLNLFENRLHTIGDYLMKEEKPKLTIYSNSEPSTVYKGMNWIE
jgi:hypothetical protein